LSYGEKRVIDDFSFSFSFEAKKKYLITGPSGSGKSTLLKAISKELNATEGEIFVSDRKRKSYDNYAMNIGVISQKPFLFNESIRYNLTLGQKFEDSTLDKALEQVGLKDEIADILDYQIENNGQNVSGGQATRIEIARFLIRQKDILLVDEVTAALDETNARKIRALLLEFPIMVIEVAHHIDPMQVYDEVIEL
jgi:ATP-binding cassette subfamily C protein